jgi:DnaJ family protein A protein 5
MDDSNGGFYETFRNLFTKIMTEERSSYENDEECVDSYYCQDFYSFGSLETQHDPGVKNFYGRFTSFSTCRSFSWVDEYKLAEIDDRRERRMAEKSNKKAREVGRRDYNETVCNLASWIKKRDPRIIKHHAILKQRAEEAHVRLQLKKTTERLERTRLLSTYEEVEWSKTTNCETIINDDESIIIQNVFECVSCSKLFKSEKAFETHEKSKKHQEALKIMKAELLDEDEFFNSIGNSSPKSISTVENGSEVQEDNGEVQAFNEAINPTYESYNEAINPAYELIPENDLVIEDCEAILNDLSISEDKIELPTTSKPEKKRRRAAKSKEPKPVEIILACNFCKSSFSSRTRLFEHIKMTGHAGFEKEEIGSKGRRKK